MPKVRVPGIYWEASARRVLTMEWVDGVKMTDEAAMAEAGLDVVKFVDVGIECTLRQLLEHGYFHADPHPGNLLATKEGELCYLDFGMMSDAPQSARYAIINHVVHLVNRDYLAMCQDYYALDFIDRSVDTRPIAPALEEFFESGVLGSSVSDLNFKAIIDGLGDVLFAFPFQVPAYYALILRSLTVLEGLALSADRDYKVLAKSYPYMAQRLLTDPSPELRGSLEEMLFSQGQFRWTRLESLYTEGSKSQAFDPTALWLLVDYIVSESAGPIRGQLTEEVVRLIDGYCATQAHQSLAAATSKEVARRLVPISGKDLRNCRRLELLTSNVQETAFKLMRPADQVPSLDRLPSLGELPSLPSPGEALGAAQTAREQAGSAISQIQKIMEKPGSGEVVNNVSGGLARKVAARTIKGINGALRQTGKEATQEA
jgi:predicted unusual protein kinase regulating ubiquinone biosynthesis (AarF/ABC1/UbiB family)